MSTETATRLRLALSGPTMGTRWSAIAYPPEGIDAVALEEALAEDCTRVDGQMSTWKPGSDLMRLNRAPLGQWQSVPPELGYVLALGEGVRRRSEGRFDMAVLASVEAAGFGAQTGLPLPLTSGGTQDSIEIDLDAGRVRRLRAVGIDLSGIAKGFAVDLMCRTMERFGIADYLVGLDGEIAAGGARGDGRPWTVALEAPVPGTRDVAARLQLSNAALATSGNYRHRRCVDGRWLSHTIDPRTGAPAETDLVSVTVHMADCVLADAWATALLVAGRNAAQLLCTENGIDAILMAETETGFETTGCGAFR
ncbi:FAD:protein FMN transferase [Devosia sp. PTR5]|uniref:FAD:protein FMN transferase n=1 Tax=Devosia oryzisoli TaxID=2774138 RepID=A0A927ITI0_9HYPH|nr:FAD:protein FMN transferase [Devosia oryzisoli]MBD8066574.1 FAD:protein FMN transferase [Devosia oryzisoli]